MSRLGGGDVSAGDSTRGHARLGPMVMGAWIAAASAVLLFFLVPYAAAIIGGGTGTGVLGALSEALRAGSLWSALSYTLGQAAASSALALLFGLPGAFLVARREFPGRRALASLAFIPLCVPAVLVALGFALFFGNEGMANRASVHVLGIPIFRFLYTTPGVVLVHGLYEFPLVVRLVGDAWSGLPGLQEDAARGLGASEPRILLGITLRQLAPAIGAATALVFLYSFFSFVVVLLVGGLSARTMEVELYRAARFDFDYARAAAVAIVETCSALVVAGVYALLEAKASAPAQADAYKTRTRRPLGPWEIPLAAAYGICVAFFLLGPLASIALRSLSVRKAYMAGMSIGLENYGRVLSSNGFLGSLGVTIGVGALAAVLSVLTGLALAVASRGGRRAARGRFFQKTAILLPLAVSSSVLALGWSRLGIASGPAFAAILALAAAQSSQAFPLVFRSVAAALDRIPASTFEAAKSLGSDTLDLGLRVAAPAAGRALLTGAILAFAISSGDATGPLMLGAKLEPLALLVYRYAGTYRYGEACAVGVVVAALSLGVFMLGDRKDDVL